ncbi:MAG: hypothetical protein WDO18_01685 [Acidobacteriota bacterium]
MPIAYPLGHPVEIESSSNDVLRIVQQRWAKPSLVFPVSPLFFEIAMVAEETNELPRFMAKEQGFTFTSGRTGRAEFDVASRSGMIVASLATLDALMDAAIFTALDWTFFIGVHAGCVMREGKSVLFCGDSGAGKSTLTFACGLAGWTVVSDNALHWANAPYDVFVSPGTPIRLREGARAMFAQRPNQEMTTATVAPAGPIVFLERRPGPVAAEPAAPEKVAAYLEQYDTRPDRAFALRRYQALASRGAWTLHYENVEDAERWLQTIL